MRRLRARYVKPPKKVEGLEIRLTEEADGQYWGQWLLEADVQRFYPMKGDKERAESVNRMQTFAKYKSGLTGVYKGEVAGVGYINLHPYRKISHHAIFTIIVGEKFRGKGIGLCMMEHLEKMARDQFGLECLHLEVYDHNPAVRLYRRLGYREFGYQTHFTKDGPGDYKGKIYMEKWL